MTKTQFRRARVLAKFDWMTGYSTNEDTPGYAQAMRVLTSSAHDPLAARCGGFRTSALRDLKLYPLGALKASVGG